MASISDQQAAEIRASEGGRSYKFPEPPRPKTVSEIQAKALIASNGYAER